MKILFSLCMCLLFVLHSNADSELKHSMIDPQKSAQCGLSLQYLLQTQLQNIQDLQARLKKQQASAEQTQNSLTQMAQILRDPDVLERIQKNPGQTIEIIMKAIEDCKHLKRKRAELSQIRENMPLDDSLDLC